MKGQISVQLSTLYTVYDFVQLTDYNITCTAIWLCFFFTFYSRFLLNMILSWTCLFHCPKNKSCCLCMFSSVTTTECLSRYMHTHNLLVRAVYLYWCIALQTCNCTAPITICKRQGIKLFRETVTIRWKMKEYSCFKKECPAKAHKTMSKGVVWVGNGGS